MNAPHRSRRISALSLALSIAALTAVWAVTPASAAPLIVKPCAEANAVEIWSRGVVPNVWQFTDECPFRMRLQATGPAPGGEGGFWRFPADPASGLTIEKARFSLSGSSGAATGHRHLLAACTDVCSAIAELPSDGVATPVQYEIDAGSGLPAGARYLTVGGTCVREEGCTQAGLPFEVSGIELEMDDANPPTQQLLVYDDEITLPSPMRIGAWNRGVVGFEIDAGDGESGVVNTHVKRVGTGDYNGFKYPHVDEYDELYGCGAPNAGFISRLCPRMTAAIKELDTTSLPPGLHTLTLDTFDGAGNVAEPLSVTFKVDNTAPRPPSELTLDGLTAGGWVNDRDVTFRWTNMIESGETETQAGISAVSHNVEPTQPGQPNPFGRRVQTAIGATSLPLTMPAEGRWKVLVATVDQAGNSSGPRDITFGVDETPPQVSIAPPRPDDPTSVRVDAIDQLSGVDSLRVEQRRVGASEWTPLRMNPVVFADGARSARLTARFDDALLPPGHYELRALAADHAGNVIATSAWPDGSTVRMAAPTRKHTVTSAGFPTRRACVPRTPPIVETTCLHAGGRYRQLATNVDLNHGKTAVLHGRVADSDGEPVTGLLLDVSIGGQRLPREQAPVTDERGQYRLRLPAAASTTVTVTAPQTDTTLSSRRAVATTTVAGRVDLRASAKLLGVGERVRLSGRVHTLGSPLPRQGKAVAIEMRFRGRWILLPGLRKLPRASGPDGAFRLDYRFSKPVSTVLLRAHVAVDKGWPFAAAFSAPVKLRVTQ